LICEPSGNGTEADKARVLRRRVVLKSADGEGGVSSDRERGSAVDARRMRAFIAELCN
jgi:hypothetical protein